MSKTSGRFPASVAVSLSLLFSVVVLATCSGPGKASVQPPSLLSIAVSPQSPHLNVGQTAHFKAIGAYSDNSTQDLTGGAVWSSSDPAAATIISGGAQAGLATAVASGTTTIQATVGGVSGSTTLTVNEFAGVLTYHNDLARTGQNLDETVVTPTDVNVNAFGKLFSDPVDGYIYAQPLFVPGVSVPGLGLHNAVYIATENDTVYAFDADAAGPPLWKASLLGPGETPVASADVSCDLLGPQIGITSTPVIDPSTNTIYVVAQSELVTGSATAYFQRVHALDITTGNERPGSPVVISATVPGTTVTFDPHSQLNRAGLALVNGDVYIGFGSFCDNTPYNGWLFSYEADNLAQVASFNVTPMGSQGAIWQGGGAPSADSSGNIYAITGNGTFDADSGGPDYGDSFLKLSPSGNALNVADYFTPFNQSDLATNDLDLGAADPLLLPDSVGSAAHPHLVIAASKGGTIYLVDRDNLGKFCGGCTSNDTQIVQELSPFQYNFSNATYWNGNVYFAPPYDSAYAFSIANGTLSSTLVSQTSSTFGYPGPNSSISANGSTNAILWMLDTSQNNNSGPAILYAYDATNLSNELYDSSQASSGRDTAGNAVKFAVPTVAKGKVYVGTQTELDIYGLLP